MRTAWGLALVWLNALLTCIVKCVKWMRPCVVSMTTLLCLMKCKPIIGRVRLFITRNCSAKMWSPMSNLSVVVAVGFSNLPFATWIWKLGGSSIFRIIDGGCCLTLSRSFWAIASHRLPSQQGHLLLSPSRNPEAHTTFLSFVLGLLWRIVACKVHWYYHPWLVVREFAKLVLQAGIVISTVPGHHVDVISLNFWSGLLGVIEARY